MLPFNEPEKVQICGAGTVGGDGSADGEGDGDGLRDGDRLGKVPEPTGSESDDATVVAPTALATVITK